MATNNNILFKKSSVPGKVPTIESLQLGELALNTADGKAYFKKTNDTLAELYEYILPPATSQSLGGIKVGAGLAVDINGVVSSQASAPYFSDIVNKPTTLSGYGITDAVYKDTNDYAHAAGLVLNTATGTSTITWNAAEGTFDVPMGAATLQLGQEQYIYGKATEHIAEGNVVMFGGAQGGHILISNATSTALNTNCNYVVGIATQDIASNAYGYVTWFGKVNGINTSIWAEGTILYFDHGSPGKLTATMPTAPNAKITVAAVTRSHATQGSIMVRPTFGSRLRTLHDVNITTQNNGDVLVWNASTSRWENTTPTAEMIGLGNVTNESKESLLDSVTITTYQETLCPLVTSYTREPFTLASFVSNVNGYNETMAINQSSGSSASADIVVYNNAASGEGLNSYYLDMGINSSNYSDTEYPIFSANSSYLYSAGGGDTENPQPSHLVIGTGTPESDVVLFAGGLELTNKIITLSGTSGNILIDTDNDTGEKVQINGSVRIAGATEFENSVTLAADPINDLEAATKKYVDVKASSGFNVHTSVRVGSTTNLTATYNNGTDGIGATLTSSTNRVMDTVDGISSFSIGDRILLKNQTNSFENGIYEITNLGSGSTQWVLTRCTDFDEVLSNEISNNAYFYVEEGSTQIGTSWILSQTAEITIGTTALPFTIFSRPVSYTTNSPLSLTGTTLSLSGVVDATHGGTGQSTVSTGNLLYGSASNTWSKLPLGVAYKSLVVNASGTNMEWNAVALNQSSAVSGQLGLTNGGTGSNLTAVAGGAVYSGASGLGITAVGTANQVLTSNGASAPTWQTVSYSNLSNKPTTLSGYVSTTSTDNALVRFDGTSGNIQNSVVTIDDTGNISSAGSLSVGNITTSGYIRGPSTFTIDPAAYGDNTGTVIIAGNLQVDGTTTTINSTTVEVDDKTIMLAKGSTNKAAADTSGIEIDLGSDGTASLLYGSTNDRFSFNKPVYSTVYKTANGSMTSYTTTLATTTATNLTIGNTSAEGSLDVMIQAKQGTAIHTTKMSITHDGTNPYYNEYGTVFTGSSLATYSVNIASGSINLNITGSSATSTVYKVIVSTISI